MSRGHPHIRSGARSNVLWRRKERTIVKGAAGRIVDVVRSDSEKIQVFRISALHETAHR